MYLSLLVFLPVAFALLVFLYPGRKGIKTVGLIFTLVEFVLSLNLFRLFDSSTAALQLVEQRSWVPNFGITYFVGVDGISFWLILLTTFLTPLIILASWNSIETRFRSFLINMLLLESAMLGTFVAMDAVLFYVFFEVSLIPMYLIVGIWGGARRIYATIKFFIYTMAGSVLMLLSIIALMYMAEEQLGRMSSSLIDLYSINIPFVAGEFFNAQTLMFVAFSLAFAIKVPLFPLHTWLPDAHVEAPTPGSVILAGVMLKMGTYGFVRFVLPIFPEATQYWGWTLLFLGVFGIIYGALVAMVQPDIKKLVAYSSVSHMGYVMAGIFTVNHLGVTGGIYQMLNHGISTGALFILVGMIYERTHSREINKYGGLAGVMPIFTICFFIVTLSSIAVPGTNGFIGEFMILLGTFNANPWYAVFAVLGVVLGAAYMLWMFKKVFFGEKGELVAEKEGVLKDLTVREMAVMAPLLVLIFWMGVFPNHFLNWSKVSIDHLVENKTSYNLDVTGLPNKKIIVAEEN